MRRLTFGPPLTLRGREGHGFRGLSGKPTHPPLTDVPIGAYTIALFCDVVSFAGGTHAWAHDFYRAATFALIGGAAVSVLTALTGFLDWLTTDKGTQIRRTGSAHGWTMVFVTLCVLGDLAWRWFAFWGARSTPAGPFALTVAAFVALIIGSTIGGSLTYDYGFNVVNSTDHPVYHAAEFDVYPDGSVKGAALSQTGPAAERERKTAT
jgi:uncharacterized membrane protein